MQASHQSDCRVPSPQKNQRFHYSVSKNVQDRFMEAKRDLVLVDEDPCRVQWKGSQRQLSLTEIVSRAKYKGQGEPLWLCWLLECDGADWVLLGTWNVSFCFVLNFKPSLNQFVKQLSWSITHAVLVLEFLPLRIARSGGHKETFEIALHSFNRSHSRRHSIYIWSGKNM